MKKEKENLPILLPSHSLQRTGRQLDIAHKLLAKRDRQKFIDFCCRHHELFISLTSRWYPLKPDSIEKFSDKWDLYYLRENETIWKKIYKQNVDDELIEMVMERRGEWR